jgi:hypothetical protein
MRKNGVTLAIIIAVLVSSASAETATGNAASGSDVIKMQGTWNCETTMTQPNGTKALQFQERDTIEYIGAAPGTWLHGTARPLDTQSDIKSSAFYDYYLRYDKNAKSWIYIQIDPTSGKYFVGTSSAKSLDGSNWTIVYPMGEGSYIFKESPLQFSIAYSDLTQVCNKMSSSVPAAAAGYTLTCETQKTGQGVPTDEYLSISQLAANWQQGVARGADRRSVIYEYNVFSTPTQRISIEINATTGSYTIAMGRASANPNETIWTVVYPTVESGFVSYPMIKNGAALGDTSPAGALPAAFTTVFKDGYQTCTAPSP